MNIRYTLNPDSSMSPSPRGHVLSAKETMRRIMRQDWTDAQKLEVLQLLGLDNQQDLDLVGEQLPTGQVVWQLKVYDTEQSAVPLLD